MARRCLTKAQKRRRMHIINTLSQLSRDGWSGARPEDYLPLEVELKELSND